MSNIVAQVVPAPIVAFFVIVVAMYVGIGVFVGAVSVVISKADGIPTWLSLLFAVVMIIGWPLVVGKALAAANSAMNEYMKAKGAK